METLTLNDGTVLLNSNAFTSGMQLYVYIENGYSIREVFNLLIEPEKTERIVRRAPDIETTFEGYTKLIAVRDEGNGLITAVLAQP